MQNEISHNKKQHESTLANTAPWQARWRVRGGTAAKAGKNYVFFAPHIRKRIAGEKIALTTDGWTSLATDAYVTVTAHFINEEWELKDIILKSPNLRKATQPKM